MQNSFWGLIWQSFLEIQTFWYGLLGFLLTIILSVVAGNTLIPLFWVIAILTIFILVIATLLTALNKAFTEYKNIKQSRIPKILGGKKETTTGNIICLLENTNLFPIGITISFYYTDEDGYERFIGGGFVQNIQSDGKIQAVFDQPYIVYQESQPIIVYQEVLEKLASNDLNVLQRTKVTIGILREFNQTLA